MARFATDEEDSLLVSRRDRQRPGTASWPIKEAWSGAAPSSGRGDIFCTPGQMKFLGDGIAEQQCSAIGRSTARDAERRLGMDSRILKVGLNDPRPSGVREDQIVDFAVVLQK